jgi:outer membrane protein assembly factor BamB
MRTLAAGLAVSVLMTAATACSSGEATPVACSAQRSTLTKVDPGTGAVTWRATLAQASELPLRLAGGVAVVTTPCGAAVVGLAAGGLRYDDPTTGDVVGVTGNRLFTLDRSSSDSTSVTGIDLGTGTPVSTFSTNTPYQNAGVANGSLITLYGDDLAAVEQGGRGPSWNLQVPAYQRPELVRSGALMLVVARDGSTFAVELADGRLVWRSVPPVAATAYSLRITSVPGTVLTSASTVDETQRRFVYATDAETGRLRWTRPALGVLAADRDVTVLRTTTAVEAVDTTDGTRRWSHPLHHIDIDSDLTTAALTRDAVVLPQPGLASLGLDRADGRLRWRGPRTTQVVAVGRVVVAATSRGIVALAPRTGAVRWSRIVDRPHQQLVVTPGHQLLILDSDLVPHLGA